MVSGRAAVVADDLEAANNLADGVEAQALESKDADGGHLGRAEATEASDSLLSGLDQSPGVLQLLPQGLV